MSKKRALFLVFSVLIFIVTVISFLFVLLKRENNLSFLGLLNSNFATTSSVPGVKISINNKDSFNEIVEKLLIPIEGVLDSTTNSFIPVTRFRVILTPEKQPTLSIYGKDQTEENYLTSASFNVENETLNILINLNLSNQYVLENKEFILNQQVAYVLLTASSKKASDITYDRDGAYRLALTYSYPSNDKPNRYPVTFVE